MLRLCLAAFVLAALCLAGCGESGPKRYHLKGKITWGETAVPAGMIFFDPDFTKGNDGQQGFAFIKDGTFDTRLNGQATMGGPHLARIQAFDGKPGNELPMGRMIGPEHSTPVELPKEDAEKDFDIPLPGNG